MPVLIEYVRRALARWGYEVIPADRVLSPSHHTIVRQVRPFTMTSPERLGALIDAVRYLVANRIEGEFVECGVWRGGSMMAAALTLLELDDVTRSLYLFDTFEGMTEPTAKDVATTGRSAKELLDANERKEGGGIWAFATRADVEQNLASIPYPADRIHLVEGKVEDTIPARAPDKIALLRLDTDWYESTRHELVHLYPRLVTNGILIIDDYGHWLGARQAADEYFRARKVNPLLNRIDYTGRLVVKPSE